MKFDIYVDSSANLTEATIEEYGIKVIPYICTCGEREVVCYTGVKSFEEEAKDYYRTMADGVNVGSSLITKERIIDAMEASLKEGKDIIMVTISAGVSGTYDQAVKAAKELNKKHPERKIYIADSANAGYGEGLLAVNAAKLREMGEDIDTCYKWIETNKFRMNSSFTVADLKYLKKGGRISAATAIAGTLLNIKPILWADAGPVAKIGVCGKVKGRKKSIAAIAETYKEKAVFPEAQTVAICHGDCEEDALALAEQLKEFGATDITITYFDIVCGTHVGPGSLALFFLGKDRRGDAYAEKVAKSSSAIGTAKNKI
ncbi:MAG: DegV family protein [Clostridia bacterium]|nr:DegV family protein [Clostridia bacterium]